MDAGLEAYYAMRELVVRHPGGCASETALAAVRKLCRLAAKAAADAECAARLAAVEENAGRLFSGTINANGARRSILAELEHFRSRLHEIEKTGTYPA